MTGWLFASRRYTRPMPFPEPGTKLRIEGTAGGEFMGPKGFDPRPKFRVPQARRALEPPG